MNYIRLTYIMAVLLFSVVLSSCGKPQLHGDVLDQNGIGINGVNVSIDNSEFTTQTDENGTYSLEFPTRDFNLVYSKKGYSSESLAFEAKEKTDLFVVNVTLFSYMNNTSPEKLAESIMNTLRTNDLDSFKSFATPDIQAVINEIKLSVEEESRERMIENISSTYVELFSNVLTSWQNTHEMGIKYGLDWSKIYDIKMDVNNNNHSGIDGASIKVFFKENNVQYDLRLQDTSVIAGKWYIFGEIKPGRISERRFRDVRYNRLFKNF